MCEREMDMEMGMLGRGEDEQIHTPYEEEDGDDRMWMRMSPLSTTSTGYLEDVLSQFINNNNKNYNKSRRRRRRRRRGDDDDDEYNNTPLYNYLHHLQQQQVQSFPHFTNSSQYFDKLTTTTTTPGKCMHAQAVQVEEEEEEEEEDDDDDGEVITMLSSSSMDDEVSPQQSHFHYNYPLQSTPCLPPHSIFSSASGVEETKKAKVTSKVVYPFALVKPGGFEGENVATLKDINQRILMPPTRPVRHPVGDFACQPLVSPDGGLGLSGKTVVAFTRLHTQGRGSITIIRTRG